MKLGMNIGDTVSVIALNGGSFRGLSPETTDFIITGIFQSGYSDFDNSLIVMSDEALRTIDRTAVMRLGIKLVNRFKDQRVSTKRERKA